MGKHTKRSFLRLSLFLIISITILIIFAYQFSKIQYLPFISYHHLAVTESIIDTEKIPINNVEYNGQLKFNYAPDSYIYNSIFKLITGISLTDSYLILPLFFMLTSLIFLLLSFREIGLENYFVIILLIFSTSILITFFSINYPQTISLVFLTAILYLTLRGFKKLSDCFLTGIILGASVCSHLNPALLSFLLIIGCLPNLKLETIKKPWLKCILFGFLGTLPFLIIYPLRLIVGSLFFKLNNKESVAMEWVKNQITWSPNYPPSVYFTELFSPILFILVCFFLFLCLRLILKREANKKILSFLPFIVLFFMAVYTGNLLLHKMLQGLLLIISVPIAFFIKKELKSRKLLIVALSIIIIFSIIGIFFKVSSLGEGYSKDPEIYYAIDWLRENTPKDSIVITNMGFEGVIRGLGKRNQFGGGSTPYTITKLLSPQEDYHQIVKYQKEILRSILCEDDKREELILKNEISYLVYSGSPTYLDIRCEGSSIRDSFSNYGIVYQSEHNRIVIFNLRSKKGIY